MNRPRRHGIRRSTPLLIMAYAALVASAACDRSVPHRDRQAATSAAAEFEQSARPYLVRAICEWCADNGLTPFLAVKVNGNAIDPAGSENRQ